MNKKLAKIFGLFLTITCITSCAVDWGENESIDSDSIEEISYTGNEKDINVWVYKAGYGQGWIDKACYLYERSHPGQYRFRIKANSRMFDTVKTTLTSNNCDADIVLVAGYDYLNLSSTGKLAELSSIFESTIPGTDTKCKDVIDEAQYKFRLMGENKDKIYGVPWQEANANGFIYNKKMFRDAGCEVPTTMDEFFAVCDKLDAKGYKPLVYGGGQQDAYTALFVPQWTSQAYGKDYMTNTFQKYASPEIYNTTKPGKTMAYQTLAKLLKGNTASGNSIALTGSKAFTAQNAQKEFIFGHAAMDLCGNWFSIEMKTLLNETPDFEYGYFSLPHLTANKQTLSGEDSQYVTYSLESSVLAIPSASKNIDVAKDFLLSMFTKESYQTFVEENKGLGRPINVEIDETKLDEYSLSCYKTSSLSHEHDQVVCEVSDAIMAINGYLGVANFCGGDFYSDIINAADYNAAMNIANNAAADELQFALSMWDASKGNWKYEYLVLR